jgi:hypothetical protein
MLDSLLIEPIKLFVETKNWLPFLAAFVGGFGALMSVSTHKDHEHRQIIFTALSGCGTILSVGTGVLYDFVAADMFGLPHVGLMYFVMCSIFGAFGSFAAWKFERIAVVKWDVWKASKTRTPDIERNRKTDVRNISSMLPAAKSSYDPAAYINIEKGLFLGLDEQGQPIYWPLDEPFPHMQIVGSNGTGKGVAIGMIVSQLVEAGEAVFYLDPKDDLWGPHVMASAAEKAGRPFYFVDLRPGAVAQFNFFEGASADQIEELLIAGFSLSEKGTDSDFYSIGDRRAARTAALRLAAEPGMTPAELYAELGEEFEKGAEKFAGYLREMADVPAVNGKGGLDLRKIVQEGGAVYIVGSMRQQKVVRLQRMMMVKLIQLAEERDRIAGNVRRIAVVLDEVKYHISRPALEALGAARDKGLHVLLAHQSFADLQDAPADLSGPAIEGAVMENARVKLVYRVEDPDTAERLGRKSGLIQVDNETRTVHRNVALAERVHDERAITQSERFLYDENMLLNLPKGVGILFGIGLARATYISPVRVEKRHDVLKVTPAQESSGGLPEAHELI